MGLLYTSWLKESNKRECRNLNLTRMRPCEALSAIWILLLPTVSVFLTKDDPSLRKKVS